MVVCRIGPAAGGHMKLRLDNALRDHFGCLLAGNHEANGFFNELAQQARSSTTRVSSWCRRESVTDQPPEALLLRGDASRTQQNRKDVRLRLEHVGERRALFVGAAFATVCRPRSGVKSIVDVKEVELSKPNLKHLAWSSQERLHRVNLGTATGSPLPVRLALRSR